MSGLQSCERVNFLPCQMPSGWCLVTAAPGEYVGHLMTGGSQGCLLFCGPRAQPLPLNLSLHLNIPVDKVGVLRALPGGRMCPQTQTSALRPGSE